MAIEPVKIPQNVQIEDRLFGPITLRQTIISLIGAGISYALWSTLQKLYGSAGIALSIIAWSPMAVFVVFAFVKVYDLSLLRLCFLLLEKTVKPQTRIWVPRTGITMHLQTFVKPDKEKKKETPSHGVTSIDELSSLLDFPAPLAKSPSSATNLTAQQ